MTNREDSLRKLTSGFELEKRSSAGRDRITGTKKTGFFTSDQRVLVCVLTSKPTLKDLDWFFKEAERFSEDSQRFDIVGIHLLAPAEVDKEQFKLLENRVDAKVAQKIKPPKVYDAEDGDEKPSQEVPRVVTEETLSKRLDVADTRLSSREPHERVLYEWEMVYGEAGHPSVPVIADITQERCVVYRRVSSDVTAFVREIRWDQVTNIEPVVVSGSPLVSINDGKRAHHLHHPDAFFIARIVRHLQWARQGYLTGFSEIYEWHSGLREVVAQSLLGRRYPTAVRDGFAYVESEIRRACNLPDGTGTREAINKAFSPTGGLLSFGMTPGEQSALHDYVTGAFGLYRNPVAHEAGTDGYDLNRSVEALNVANSILGLVNRGQIAARQRPLVRPRESREADRRPSAAFEGK